MRIYVDSDEYKCWHEVGHATVCLHLGGDVDFIEFLEGDSRGYARARCVDNPDIERSVACAGLAAEVYLLKNGYAEQAPDDKRDINTVWNSPDLPDTEVRCDDDLGGIGWEGGRLLGSSSLRQSSWSPREG